jgi:hypothetical protein
MHPWTRSIDFVRHLELVPPFGSTDGIGLSDAEVIRLGEAVLRTLHTQAQGVAGRDVLKFDLWAATAIPEGKGNAINRVLLHEGLIVESHESAECALTEAGAAWVTARP